MGRDMLTFLHILSLWIVMVESSEYLRPYVSGIIGMEENNVLLPITNRYLMNYTLVVIGGEKGCFNWQEMGDMNLLDIIPIYNNERNEEIPYRESGRNCASKAVVKLRDIHKHANGKRTTAVLASDETTRTHLRTAVTYAEIRSLEVVTKSKKYFLNLPEQISLDGYDEFGNRFSTLKGISFIWMLDTEEITKENLKNLILSNSWKKYSVQSLNEEIENVKISRVSETDVVPKRDLLEMEQLSLYGSSVFGTGQKTGISWATAAINDPYYLCKKKSNEIDRIQIIDEATSLYEKRYRQNEEKKSELLPKLCVRTPSFEVIVHARLSISPSSDRYILVGGIVHYRLLIGTTENFDEPFHFANSPQYFVSVQLETVGRLVKTREMIDDHSLQSVEATSLGITNIEIHDEVLEKEMAKQIVTLPESTMMVVEPSRIELRIFFKLKRNEFMTKDKWIEIRKNDDQFILFENETYKFQLELFDDENHQIFICDNYRFEWKFDSLHLRNISRNGIFHQFHTIAPGESLMESEFLGVMSIFQDKFLQQTFPLKKEIRLLILKELSVLPTYSHWLVNKNFENLTFPIEVDVEGGTGRYFCDCKLDDKDFLEFSSRNFTGQLFYDISREDFSGETVECVIGDEVIRNDDWPSLNERLSRKIFFRFNSMSSVRLEIENLGCYTTENKNNLLNLIEGQVFAYGLSLITKNDGERIRDCRLIKEILSIKMTRSSIVSISDNLDKSDEFCSIIYLKGETIGQTIVNFHLEINHPLSINSHSSSNLFNWRMDDDIDNDVDGNDNDEKLYVNVWDGTMMDYNKILRFTKIDSSFSSKIFLTPNNMVRIPLKSPSSIRHFSALTSVQIDEIKVTQSYMKNMTLIMHRNHSTNSITMNCTTKTRGYGRVLINTIYISPCHHLNHVKEVEVFCSQPTKAVIIPDVVDKYHCFSDQRKLIDRFQSVPSTFQLIDDFNVFSRTSFLMGDFIDITIVGFDDELNEFNSQSPLDILWNHHDFNDERSVKNDRFMSYLLKIEKKPGDYYNSIRLLSSNYLGYVQHQGQVGWINDSIEAIPLKTKIIDMISLRIYSHPLPLTDEMKLNEKMISWKIFLVDTFEIVFDIIGGSDFYLYDGDEEILEIFILENDRLSIKGKSIGKGNLTVIDRCQFSVNNRISNQLTSGMEVVDLNEIFMKDNYRFEMGETINIDMLITDTMNDSIPSIYFHERLLKISFEFIENDGEDVEELVNYQIDGNSFQNFSVRLRLSTERTGIIWLKVKVSYEENSEKFIWKETKLIIYSPLRLLPETTIIIPCTEIDMTISGGPSVEDLVEYQLEFIEKNLIGRMKNRTILGVTEGDTRLVATAFDSRSNIASIRVIEPQHFRLFTPIDTINSHESIPIWIELIDERMNDEYGKMRIFPYQLSSAKKMNLYSKESYSLIRSEWQISGIDREDYSYESSIELNGNYRILKFFKQSTITISVTVFWYQGGSCVTNISYLNSDDFYRSTEYRKFSTKLQLKVNERLFSLSPFIKEKQRKYYATLLVPYHTEFDISLNDNFYDCHSTICTKECRCMVDDGNENFNKISIKSTNELVGISSQYVTYATYQLLNDHHVKKVKINYHDKFGRTFDIVPTQFKLSIKSLRNYQNIKIVSNELVEIGIETIDQNYHFQIQIQDKTKLFLKDMLTIDLTILIENNLTPFDLKSSKISLQLFDILQLTTGEDGINEKRITNDNGCLNWFDHSTAVVIGICEKNPIVVNFGYQTAIIPMKKNQLEFQMTFLTTSELTDKNYLFGIEKGHMEFIPSILDIPLKLNFDGGNVIHPKFVSDMNLKNGFIDIDNDQSILPFQCNLMMVRFDQLYFRLNQQRTAMRRQNWNLTADHWFSELKNSLVKWTYVDVTTSFDLGKERYVCRLNQTVWDENLIERKIHLDELMEMLWKETDISNKQFEEIRSILMKSFDEIILTIMKYSKEKESIGREVMDSQHIFQFLLEKRENTEKFYRIHLRKGPKINPKKIYLKNHYIDIEIELNDISIKSLHINHDDCQLKRLSVTDKRTILRVERQMLLSNLQSTENLIQITTINDLSFHFPITIHPIRKSQTFMINKLYGSFMESQMNRFEGNIVKNGEKYEDSEQLRLKLIDRELEKGNGRCLTRICNFYSYLADLKDAKDMDVMETIELLTLFALVDYDESTVREINNLTESGIDWNRSSFGIFKTLSQFFNYFYLTNEKTEKYKKFYGERISTKSIMSHFTSYFSYIPLILGLIFLLIIIIRFYTNSRKRPKSFDLSRRQYRPTQPIRHCTRSPEKQDAVFINNIRRRLPVKNMRLNGSIQPDMMKENHSNHLSTQPNSSLRQRHSVLSPLQQCNIRNINTSNSSNIWSPYHRSNNK
ncbi:hypothetical protein SNEBB_002250 [Seison nebaliae]|nr:hypothetical protein SNEBB_002250 [Seison nebaliae]